MLDHLDNYMSNKPRADTIRAILAWYDLLRSDRTGEVNALRQASYGGPTREAELDELRESIEHGRAVLAGGIEHVWRTAAAPVVANAGVVYGACRVCWKCIICPLFCNLWHRPQWRTPTVPSPMVATDATELDAHKVIPVDFWGQQVGHIAVATDDVRVCLEEAIKKFYGSNHSGNIARHTAAAIETVLNGLLKRLKLSLWKNRVHCHPRPPPCCTPCPRRPGPRWLRMR